ncbi:DEAD/DEAH box helicase [Treponema sp.]|uniref:DEAD/DEAH box helicase n=1 Tax=Treponema sp. TaxID=166 RepID=UPI00298E8F70|nr:DEAD/DEAH box helicase [Treponema sp.]MCR5612932.1 DEAD/DEAH box helicase [Treponema sp.]
MENFDDITDESKIINESEITDENITDEAETISFEDLGLDEKILTAIEKKGFKTPSPIQVLAIPRLLGGDSNVIARARTGTGKTAAFGLPLVQTLRERKDCVRALILEPTRELAVQTAKEMQSFTEDALPHTCVVYGGASMGQQIRDLKRGTEIVTGTPGRVKDLIDRGVLDLSKIEYFILDEGDEMLDMGFIEDIEEIFSKANPDCRVLLFSATMPAPILKIAQKFMGEYEIVEEEGVLEEPLLIEQRYWMVRESDKIEALVRLIDLSPDFYGLVFTQTKNDADTVSKMLDEKGYEAAALHGDIPQSQREKVLGRFRSKKTRILVATDVAARGIDISGLSHVVNYSLPFDASTYVHRIGRTGRAGSAGMAFTFVTPSERRKLGFLKAGVAKASKGDLIEEKIPSIDAVLEVKKNRILEDLKKKVLKHSKLDEYFVNMASLLCGASDSESEPELSVEEVLARVLSVMYGSSIDKKRYAVIKPVTEERGGRDRDRSVRVKPNQARLYVQLGKKDGYNAKKISEYFSKLLNIPNHQVDKIDVASTFTLLNLPKQAALKVLEISKKDKKFVHVHLDSKSENTIKAGSGHGRSEGSRSRERSSKGEGRTGRAKSSAKTERTGKSKSEGRASLYKKKAKK